MTRQAMPYRLPATDTVVAGGWMLAMGEEHVALPDKLPHWDYQTNLVLRRAVEIDVKSLRVGAGLSPSAPLALAVVWTASGSGLRAPGCRVTLSGHDKEACEIEVLVPGQKSAAG